MRIIFIWIPSKFGGFSNVTVGAELYPLPASSITIFVTTPSVISAWLLHYLLMLLFGAEVYPAPPYVIFIALTEPMDIVAVAVGNVVPTSTVCVIFGAVVSGAKFSNAK